MLSSYFSVKQNKPIYFLLLLCTVICMCSFSSCTKETTEDEYIGNWKRGSEFEGVGRTEGVTFTIGNDVYVGGGFDGTDRLNDFWRFNQSTGTWFRIADFPGIARNSAIAFAINGRGYVGTGIDDNNNRLKDIWEYNPTNNTWTRKADFAGTARYNAVAFSINNKGYIATGYDGNYLKDMWEYDGATNTWTQKASVTGSKRSEAVAFVHNNKAYILSGFNNGSYLNDFWVYDQATNSWTEKRKISDATDEEFDDDYGENIRRANAVAFVLGDRAFITLGNRGGIIGTTWEYNIANDLWIQKTVFEGSAREGSLSFTVNNKCFITTGSNSSFRFDDLWEFQPDVEVNDDDN